MAKTRDERKEHLSEDDLPSGLSIRMVSVLAMRSSEELGLRLYNNYFESYNGDDPIALQFTLQGALELSRLGSTPWRPNLDLVSRCYRAGSNVFFPHHHRDYKGMPINLARTIMDRAEELPGDLVRLAEEQCKKEVAAKITPVIRVAEKERWFESA